MSDIIRHHNLSDEQKAQIKDKYPSINFAPVLDLTGIGKSGYITSQDYAGVPDALATGSKQANKPASSIPSIFARAIFFRTALLNITPDTIIWSEPGNPPVYHQIVSQWLDLMETVFNNSLDLSFEVWEMSEQLRNLRDSGHNELADAFENHVNKYFPNYAHPDKTVDSTRIFLIKDAEGKFIGATSPYTFVYTSANWTSGKPTASLLQREKEFRKFMYRLRNLYNSTIPEDIMNNKGEMVKNPARNGIAPMLKYIENCLNQETDDALKKEVDDEKTSTTEAFIKENYPTIMTRYNGSDVEVLAGTVDYFSNRTEHIEPMPLRSRNTENLQSDLFIDSDIVTDFDAKTAPMVLAAGQQGNLVYYDGYLWSAYTQVPQTAHTTDDPTKLPECKAYRHFWLTDIDFLEEKLVKLPYNIDNAKFETFLAGDTCYLLPFKSRLFQYFSIDKIRDILKMEHDAARNMLSVTLTIPVRNNDGTRRGSVTMKKDYNLAQDVVETNPFAGALTLGISPFISVPANLKAKCPTLGNQISVLLHYTDINGSNPVLTFYGRGRVIEITNTNINRGSRADGVDFYRLEQEAGAFPMDAVRLTFDANISDAVGNVTGHTEVGAAIIPKMETVQQGTDDAYYSIDFGTTNTHIAYKLSSDTAGHSFKAADLRGEVVYLAKQSPEIQGLLSKGQDAEAARQAGEVYSINGKQLTLDEARMFYPNFVGDDFTFPIRTALHHKTKPEDRLFLEGSIGFRYHKETYRTDLEKYTTSLKWDLNANGGADAQTKVQLYFDHLLTIVRNHWLALAHADKSKTPTIALTYPLSMPNFAAMQGIWNTAYMRAFGQQAGNKLIWIPESLAPAQSLINSGNALVTQGILNVDIGGGTTDIQYYRRQGTDITACYNSVLYAGDDLWGVGYENVAPARDVHQNLFTRLAESTMNGEIMKIGYDEIPFNNRITLRGKELVNMLLRDSKNNFMRHVTGSDGGQSLTVKVMMLHYAALLFHIVKWMKSSTEMQGTFPAVINFTGLGSKYIQQIFGGDSRKLDDFTIALLKQFGITDLPTNLKISFSSNPKDVTAEGAVLIAGNPAMQGMHITKPLYMGYPGGNRAVGLENIKPLKDQVLAEFGEFIDKFQKACEDAGESNLADLYIQRLTERASESFGEMLNYKTPTPVEGQPMPHVRIADSLFFWTLKGSLYNLDN